MIRSSVGSTSVPSVNTGPDYLWENIFE